MKRASDCQVATQYSVSKESAIGTPEYKEYAHRRAVEQISHFIAAAKTTQEDGNYATTYRINLYVFSPDEFWEIVQREAMDLEMRMRAPKATGG